MQGRAYVLLCMLASAWAYDPTPHGVLVTVGSRKVEIAVEGLTAFRVSVSLSGAPVQIDSPFIEPKDDYAQFQIQTKGTAVGIATGFGAAFIDTSSSVFTLYNSAGKVLTSNTFFGAADDTNKTTASKNDTCASPLTGYDINGGQRVPKYPDGVGGMTQQQCCSLCNSDSNCTVWVWADPQHPDPGGKNCWLMMNVNSFSPRVGRTIGGAVPTPPPLIKLTLGMLSSGTKFYGAGGGFDSVMSITATSSYAHVSNTEFNVPQYWSNDGYSAFGVSPIPYNANSLSSYDVSWVVASPTVTWTIAGSQADLYLMPAPTMQDGLRVYWDLTGRPRMLPRYAYGFMACRWGWTNREYIEEMLVSFRNGSFPIDAWISDFEVVLRLCCAITVKILLLPMML